MQEVDAKLESITQQIEQVEQAEQAEQAEQMEEAEQAQQAEQGQQQAQQGHQLHRLQHRQQGGRQPGAAESAAPMEDSDSEAGPQPPPGEFEPSLLGAVWMGGGAI